LQLCRYVLRRDDFVVGQAVSPVTAFQAALGCGPAVLYYNILISSLRGDDFPCPCFVLQHLDFFSACDDFVGRARPAHRR
jgi:hypothetical protein